MNNTVIGAVEVQKALRAYRARMRMEEEDVDYREYVDGIISSAIAVLGLITSDYK